MDEVWQMLLGQNRLSSPFRGLTYRTEALYIHPSPLGLVGDRWVIEHHCTTCHQHVAADQLITHARTHHNDQCQRTSHDKP